MDFIRGKYKMLLCIILPHMSINTKNTIFRYIKQRAASLFLGSCRLSYLYIFMSFQNTIVINNSFQFENKNKTVKNNCRSFNCFYYIY